MWTGPNIGGQCSGLQLPKSRNSVKLKLFASIDLVKGFSWPAAKSD